MSDLEIIQVKTLIVKMFAQVPKLTPESLPTVKAQAQAILDRISLVEGDST